jgi:hypothetical protein
MHKESEYRRQARAWFADVLKEKRRRMKAAKAFTGAP